MHDRLISLTVNLLQDPDAELWAIGCDAVIRRIEVWVAVETASSPYADTVVCRWFLDPLLDECRDVPDVVPRVVLALPGPSRKSTGGLSCSCRPVLPGSLHLVPRGEHLIVAVRVLHPAVLAPHVEVNRGPPDLGFRWELCHVELNVKVQFVVANPRVTSKCDERVGTVVQVLGRALDVSVLPSARARLEYYFLTYAGLAHRRARHTDAAHTGIADDAQIARADDTAPATISRVHFRIDAFIAALGGSPTTDEATGAARTNLA